MFDHVEFTVSDITAARRIYGALCKAAGVPEAFFDTESRCLGYGREPVIHLLLTEGPATAPPLHLCLAVRDKASVDGGHAAALAAGAKDNGAPGYRPDYSPGYYAAFVLDPDGHNIELLFREG
ncbi:MAG: VOC family protein [Pseudomonadota bacterium]